MRPIDKVLDRIDGVDRSNMARCPAHDDKNPSLSIREGNEGRALLKCHAGCAYEDILAAMGLERKDLNPNSGETRSWEIRDANGELKGTHHRKDKQDGTKQVWWRGPNGKKKLGTGTADLPLYGADRLDGAGWVVLAEGEPATDALLDAGIPALGTVTGASKTPSPEALEILAGCKVTLWPDADDPGRGHMDRIAAELRGIAREVLWFEPNEAPEGGDAADHLLVKDGKGDALRELVDGQALEWEPPEQPQESRRGPLSAKELMKREFPPVRWAVEGIVPEGVTLLGGKPKQGKSWLCLGLCVAVASGGVALGTKPVEKGEALYLGLEDNERRLQRRLTQMLGEEECPDGLYYETAWPRLHEGGETALDEWLQEHPDCRLVVVDTLAKTRRETSGNNVYRDDYSALEPLLPIAAEHQVSIIVVHHLRKGEATDPLDMVSGSTGLTGGVDNVLILAPGRGQSDATLYVAGRDIEEPAELALNKDKETAGWTILGDAAEHSRSELRNAILAVLQEAGEPMGPKEVADALEREDHDAVRQRLYQMTKSGDAKRVGRGSYTTVSSE